MTPDDPWIEHARSTRALLQQGALRGARLGQRLREVPTAERDAWLDEVLELPTLVADQPSLPPGTVPYLPCAVDVIVAALREAPVGAESVFVDLGAGLGRVVLLAQLLCGARAVGIELQPALVEQARRGAAKLGLAAEGGLERAAVELRCGDAADCMPEDGTVFFVYASFGLSALRRVLARLRTIALRQRITLCAIDFCVPSNEFPWLRARPSSRCELVFYDSQI